MDERFCDVGRGVTLCYETFGDPADPPLLLIMGLGMQMVGWHPDFCAELVQRGFHVVRFDNRDAGRSTHFSGPAPKIGQLVTPPLRVPASTSSATWPTTPRASSTRSTSPPRTSSGSRWAA